jgi:hypothetical protein
MEVSGQLHVLADLAAAAVVVVVVEVAVAVCRSLQATSFERPTKNRKDNIKTGHRKLEILRKVGFSNDGFLDFLIQLK